MILRKMDLHQYVVVSTTLLGLFIPGCAPSKSSCHSPQPCDEVSGLMNCACVPCLQNQYRVMKSGRPICERCTGTCSGDRNLVEVSPCGLTQNRVCHCNKGFFCESRAQYSCRRCQPCPAGTFSSNMSIKDSCQPYTDCAGLGLPVISNGTSTRDQLCPTPIPYTSTQADLHSEKVGTTQFSAPQQTNPPHITTHQTRNTSQLRTTPDQATALNNSINRNSKFPDVDPSSSVSPLVLLAALMAAAVLVLCCIWHKHPLLKRKGWPFLKHLQGQARKEDMSIVSQELLACQMGKTQEADAPKEQGVTHCSRDSVSNNVGTIYIYSPRMVVLGASTAEQREEVRPPEDVEAHLGTPHQEQGPLEPSLTECVQEEERKELAYPVPASSK